MKRKYQLTQAWVVFLLLQALVAWAGPSKIDWALIPALPNPRHYENKEYKTADEYIKALQEGKCSSTWFWMHSSEEEKVDLINNFKGQLKEGGRAIASRPAVFYIEAMDAFIASHPEAKDYQVGGIFKTIAMIQYDFDEGMSITELKRKWLKP